MKSNILIPIRVTNNIEFYKYFILMRYTNMTQIIISKLYKPFSLFKFIFNYIASWVLGLASRW